MNTQQYTPRLEEKYKKEIIPALVKKFGYGSIMQAPKLEKVSTLTPMGSTTVTNPPSCCTDV